MSTLAIILAVIVVVLVLLLSMTIKIVRQYEQGLVFRLGRVTGAREPGPCETASNRLGEVYSRGPTGCGRASL